ncbi:MAG TPA: hypothetical protein ENJ69_02660, partial [Bacteroidetes bacterium]|nr:hypothetical protein [Bacteroidota bacterium]
MIHKKNRTLSEATRPIGKLSLLIFLMYLLFSVLRPLNAQDTNNLTSMLSDSTSLSVLLKDSLLSPLERMILTKKMATLYQNTDPGKALVYNKLIMKQARALNDQPSLAHALFHAAENYQALGQHRKADSLYEIIIHSYKMCNKEKKARLLLKLADNYFYWSRYKKAA